MTTNLATALTEAFGVQVNFDPQKGLVFASPQPLEMQTALTNVIEALKYYAFLTKGGKQYKVLCRKAPDNIWVEVPPDFDNCNDAILRAATLSKDPESGDFQVYDRLYNREIINFPAGGL
jgi:hypothetical protein